MPDTIHEVIDRLRAHELDAAYRVNTPVDMARLDDTERMRDLEACAIDLFTGNRSPRFHVTSWSADEGSNDLPLPLRLILQTSPIVNVPPVPATTLVGMLGVAVPQLETLAAENMVQLSLAWTENWTNLTLVDMASTPTSAVCSTTGEQVPHKRLPTRAPLRARRL